MNVMVFLPTDRLIEPMYLSGFVKLMAASCFRSQNLRKLKGSKVPRRGSYLYPYKEHSHKHLCSIKSREKKSFFNEVTPLPTTECSLVLRPAF